MNGKLSADFVNGPLGSQRKKFMNSDDWKKKVRWRDHNGQPAKRPVLWKTYANSRRDGHLGSRRKRQSDERSRHLTETAIFATVPTGPSTGNLNSRFEVRDYGDDDGRYEIEPLNAE